MCAAWTARVSMTYRMQSRLGHPPRASASRKTACSAGGSNETCILSRYSSTQSGGCVADGTRYTCDGVTGREVLVQFREDHDVELQPLRLVDVHDPDPGLGRILDLLRLDVLDEVRRTERRLEFEGRRLIDQLAQPPPSRAARRSASLRGQYGTVCGSSPHPQAAS